MLGRRNPQASFFHAQSLPPRVPQDSFHGRVGAHSDLLFRDDDLAEMYCPDSGRPSLPPSLMSGVLLLQFHDDVSDGEAVERAMFDQRWKVALNLPIDYAGFDPSSLNVFRKRCLQHGRKRYAFGRFVEVGRAAGFLPDKVTLLIDTTSAEGAGAVQDTYTLLRKGIRKLLKAVGYHQSGKRRGLCSQAEELVVNYVDRDARVDIDWSDPQQRATQLKVLVQDAETVLDLALAETDDAEVRAIGWLLAKILGDDLDTDEQGDPRIAQATAPDRTISMTDTQMRNGHKSRARRFDGFKISVATEQSSELILDIADMAAADGDGKELMPTIERVEQYAHIEVQRVIGDGAYNSGENLSACAHYRGHGVDLVVPFRRPADPEVDKSAFQMDLERQTVTCPQGHTIQERSVRDGKGRDILRFAYPRAVCETCPLFERCVRSKVAGRSVTTHAHEAYLLKARARRQTGEFKRFYPTRSAVERNIAQLVTHGMRDTRHVGQRKRKLQRLWTTAGVNLKRLFQVAQSQAVDLRAVFAALERPVQVTTPV